MVNLFVTSKLILVFSGIPAQILTNMLRSTTPAHPNLAEGPLGLTERRKNCPPGFYKAPPVLYGLPKQLTVVILLLTLESNVD